MGPGEFLSLLAVLVRGLIGLTILTSAYKAKMKVRERELELRIAEAKNAAQAMPVPAEAATDRIEQRLRVLERIATDKSARVAQEIEDLRTVEFN